MNDSKNNTTAATQTYLLTFDECEHCGDLDNYVEMLHDACFQGVDTRCSQPYNEDEDDERGRIRINFAGTADELRDALREADIYGWISGLRQIS